MSRPAALAAYGAATALLSPLAPALLAARARRGKEDPQRLAERLGHAGAARPEGPLAWLHGASVGESLSLTPLVEAIAQARPDVALLVTSGTRTAAGLLAQRLPPGVIHQYAPIDTPGAARRFLAHWRPGLAVRVESELWPNLILATARSGARQALLSAKLSQASLNGWVRAPRSAQALLGAFDLILAKDGEAAARFDALGAQVAGLADLKFGAPPPPADPAALAAIQVELEGRPVILAVSTHPGDDELILEAFAPLRARPERPLLILAPRHPERGLGVAAVAWAKAFAVTVRSAGEPLAAGDVHVADTLGEMGLWLRLARLAVIGGGFTPGVGGHNPLEPSRLGVPFVSGPHVANWASAYDELWRASEDGPADSVAALRGRMLRALSGDLGLARGASLARAYVEVRDAEAQAVTAQVLALLPPPAPPMTSPPE